MYVSYTCDEFIKHTIHRYVQGGENLPTDRTLNITMTPISMELLIYESQYDWWCVHAHIDTIIHMYRIYIPFVCIIRELTNKQNGHEKQITDLAWRLTEPS